MMQQHPQHSSAPRTFCFLAPGRRALAVLAGDTQQSGGAEAQTARIAQVVAARGHDVALIYGSGGDGRRMQIGGVTCVDAYPAWRRPASLSGFWHTLDELGPGLIYARLPDDFLALAGLYAARRPACRLVYGVANDRFTNPWRSYDYHAWFHNSAYALGLRWADVVAVQHEDQAHLVRPHARGAIVQVPNLAPPPAAARPFGLAATDVIWVAQIRPQKQLRLLLDLADRLPARRFTVIGGFDITTPPAEAAALGARLAATPNVRFLGAQPAAAVAAELARSKLLVNTSRHEGFPNTMLEAWSHGVPVVSLSVDPGRVIAREGLGLVSGTPERLVADVERLCASRALNEAAGAAGRAYVQRRHSADAVYTALLGLLPAAEERSVGAGEGRP